MHLTETQPRLFSEAVRAEARVDMAMSRVRSQGTLLRGKLDKATDDLAADIRSLWERARDRKDSRSYSAALDVAAEWARASSLYEWSLNTSRQYRQRRANTYPIELEFLEHEAATAVGEKRTLVPVEALRRDGAPPPQGAPADYQPRV